MRRSGSILSSERLIRQVWLPYQGSSGSDEALDVINFQRAPDQAITVALTRLSAQLGGFYSR